MADIDLGCNPKFKRFRNYPYKYCCSLPYHFPVPPEIISYLSAHIWNFQGQWGYDGNSMGWSCIQSDALYVGKSCKLQLKMTFLTETCDAVNKYL